MGADAQPVAARRVRLTYADTDAAGILYFAAWFPWMERVSVEWLYSKGFRVDEMLARYGAVPVTRATSCDYLAPAKVYDEVSIEMCIAHVGTRSYRLGFTMTRHPDAVAVARSSMALVLVDGDGRPVPIPAAYRSVLDDARRGHDDAAGCAGLRRS